MQAAFTNPELKELGELAGAEVYVPPAEAELDALSRQALATSSDRAATRKVEMIQSYAQGLSGDKERQLIMRFLVSPVELFGDASGQVVGLRLVQNELYATDAGTLRPRATAVHEDLPVGLVFRSVGYQGVPLPDIPFDDRWGVILNQLGRILDAETSRHMVGLYTAGWIKRGPTGVIGTNKPDALETVQCMLDDAASGAVLTPEYPKPEDAASYIRQRQPQYVSFGDWQRLDAMEVERGQALGRPRLKFTRVEDMLVALRKATVS
jgi:ferredoxin--NADP+ reductase